MFNISQFLERARNRRSAGVASIEAVRSAVMRFSKVDVPEGSLSVKSGSLIISGLSQAARSEIFIKRHIILEELGRGGQGPKLTEIRFK